MKKSFILVCNIIVTMICILALSLTIVILSQRNGIIPLPIGYDLMLGERLNLLFSFNWWDYILLSLCLGVFGGWFISSLFEEEHKIFPKIFYYFMSYLLVISSLISLVICQESRGKINPYLSPMFKFPDSAYIKVILFTLLISIFCVYQMIKRYKEKKA
jgi:hypothetical protein